VSRFGVLGPLQAWRGERAVDLGPVRQRVVLAVLLLQAGRPIARQQIINAVWGEEPPIRAVNLVQRHVSGLRRALGLGEPGRAASCRLVWTDAGYQLALPPGALDLEVLQSELSRARAARQAGDQAETARALHSALALWRGPVCDGLSSPFLDAQRDRLAESRISVLEERIELDLALGQHADVVAELRDLVADHPLRERLHELLMRALYQAGRQGDALAAFREARRRLHEELGVEPAAALQQLHQQILAADPALAPRPAAPAPLAAGVKTEAAGVRPGGATVEAGSAAVRTEGAASSAYRRPKPGQLPHAIPDFIGREAEVGMLNALLPAEGAAADGPIVIAAIAGTAGVGKSALALHWGHQIRSRYPDGQLYVNLRGFDPAGPAMDPADAIRGFLDAFAVPPDRIPVDLDAQAALYRSILADLRVLIVLDNARDPAQVRPLLPGAPGCLVVVTSRSQLIGLTADGARSVSLDLLLPAEARQLLTIRLGAERVSAEPLAVDEIIDGCAGLPLALSIVTARAAANPRLLFADLAEELLDNHGGLDALDGGDKRVNIRAVFSWSYSALSAPAARLFRLLGLHMGPDIGMPAAASLAGETPAQARALLAELTRAHMLADWGHGRFVFHDLLRAYASELAETHDPATDRTAAIRRVLDHYLLTAHRADELIRPNREDAITSAPAAAGVTPQKLSDHKKALAWFGREYPVLLAALRQAGQTGFHVHVWQLAWALTSFFDRLGHWHDAATSQRAAVEAATQLGDPRAQAVSYGCRAYAYLRLDRHQDAHSDLSEALRLYEELGDETGQAHAHRSLAWVFDRLGEYREALPHAQRAYELLCTTGQQNGQARALNAVGWFHIQLGEAEEGLMQCQHALNIQQQIKDEYGQADTLDSIASAYHHLGRYSDAAAHYRRALPLYRDFGDRYTEADTWASLGDTYLAAGDHVSAHAAWRSALDILDNLGHPDAARVREKLTAPETAPKSILTEHR
jgi:DNA-binding SARP family transcriptional activator/Tfp pilus assembly protein PilF